MTRLAAGELGGRRELAQEVQVRRQLVFTVRQKRVANSSAEIPSARSSRGLSVRCCVSGGGAFSARCRSRRMASALSASMRASSCPNIGQLAVCQLLGPPRDLPFLVPFGRALAMRPRADPVLGYLN